MADEESEVFEITDFTTASEWERFIARIEEVIHEWKIISPSSFVPLKKGDLTGGIWDETHETLKFADFPFTLTWHHLKQDQVGVETEDGTGGDEKEDALPTCLQDMMKMDNDFPSRAHCLCRWYGLRDFVVLAPAQGSDAILSESKVNLLMSSLAIAINNTGCQFPMFVQVHDKWRRLYYGHCEVPGIRTNFEMVHLKKIPPQYNHLAGLLDVFKGKLASPVSPLPPVIVSVRFTYVLQDWAHSAWTQAPPDFDSALEDEVGCTEFDNLPFGACEDPVSELHLSTTWPSLSEDMIVDNDSYTDLDPLQAPLWCVRVRMTENPQCLLGEFLSEFVSICHRRESTDQLLGKHLFTEEENEAKDVSQALQRLTEPTVNYHIPSLSKVVGSTSTKLKIKPEEAPIPEAMLNQLLLFLFPDAEKSDNMTAVEDSENAIFDSSEYKDLSRALKSSPVDSLLYKLAVCICIINHHQGGLRAVAHLWQEFVLEMRYRWENNYTITGLENGSPNLGSCLLNQKLQMLNCCILAKKKREERHQEANKPTKDTFNSATRQYSTDLVSFEEEDRNDQSDGELMQRNLTQNEQEETDQTQGSDQSESERTGSDDNDNEDEGEDDEKEKNDDDDEDDEDEFYECNESMSQTSLKTLENTENSSGACKDNKENDETDMDFDDDADLDLKDDGASSVASENKFSDSVTIQPEGRLRPFNEMNLLDKEEKLYIPITQEPAPMTEDLLEEHAEVLAKLGTSAEGAHLRARMQSACLLSDMESFKAANPGCLLEDFVRWYSPRDYIEQEVEENGIVVKKGELSQRMQIPGNMWVEVWHSAKPVPARRQKRLFDDTKEAEKVLHFLASLKPGQVALHLMPMLVHAAIVKLYQNEEKCINNLSTLIQQLSNKASKTTRAANQDIKKYEELVRQICLAELVIARARSLKSKFHCENVKEGDKKSDMEQFVCSLLEQPEVEVLGAAKGAAGAIIHKLFAEAQKSANMVTDDPAEEPHPSQPRPNSPTVPDFPKPAGREYILRTLVPRPAPYSKVTPQRMFCVLVKDDFRLAGAFTSDTTFQ